MGLNDGGKHSDYLSPICNTNIHSGNMNVRLKRAGNDVSVNLMFGDACAALT